jgi:integrase
MTRHVGWNAPHRRGLVAVHRGAVSTDAKNARSRRVIPLDDETLRALVRRRKEQAEERLAAGATWEDHDLIVATHAGRPVCLAASTGRWSRSSRRLASPASRRTAFATQRPPTWSGGARDVGELRAVADVLGHSPDMLMKVYAHALPESTRAVADRIGRRRPAMAHEQSGRA